MAGDIFAKEGSAVTITSTGASTSSGTAASAGDIDLRAAGTANLIEAFEGQFELTAQWATITGITGGVSIADLFLVPKLDGTNAADVDTTATTSRAPLGAYADTFVCAKAPTANTNMRFITGIVKLFPMLYTVYIINRSGQTISANWALKVVAARAQYT